MKKPSETNPKDELPSSLSLPLHIYPFQESTEDFNLSDIWNAGNVIDGLVKW